MILEPENRRNDKRALPDEIASEHHAVSQWEEHASALSAHRPSPSRGQAHYPADAA